MSKAYEINSFSDIFASEICCGKQLVANGKYNIEVYRFLKPGDAVYVWFDTPDIVNNSQSHYLVLDGSVEIRFRNRREIISSGQSISVYTQENFSIVASGPSQVICFNDQRDAIVDNRYEEIVEEIGRLEVNDPYTKGHNVRVSLYTAQILNWLHPECRHTDVYLAANYHDVGKVRLDPAILNLERRLTPEEFEHIKKHPVYSYEIMLQHGVSKQAAEWARWHHERLDGSGYPDGLKGDEIPLESRCMAVADVFDALTTNRCYRPGLSFDEALGIILKDVTAGKLDGDAFEALTCLIYSGCITQGKDNEFRTEEKEKK